jgi:hypothetical protein
MYISRWHSQGIFSSKKGIKSFISGYTECNWKVQTNYGHKFHIPKQGKMSISTSVQKHLICELQWKEYCWCFTVFQHILAMLCTMLWITLIMADGLTSWPPRMPHMNHLDVYLWGHLKTVVYAVPVDNEETLYHHILNACQTICNYPRILKRMQWSMIRRVEAYTESHGGQFEHLLIYTIYNHSTLIFSVYFH